MQEQIKASKIFVVDDVATNIIMLERILAKQGFSNLESTTDAEKVLALFDYYKPDLLILDLNMPNLDGYEVLKALGSRITGQSYVPVLVLTADITSEAKLQALSLGAKDFLTKPFDVTELMLRVKNLLQTKLLINNMDGLVKSRTKQLETSLKMVDRSREDAFEMLALMAEYRDDDTGEHTLRVANIAAKIAREMGLQLERVESLRQAARLHDIGKVAISDNILLKKGALSDDEYTTIKSHAAIGHKILSRGSSAVFRLAASISETHHERWDGGGYPNRLVGEAIPIEGRITAVADVYDALSSDRPYRKAWPKEKVLAELKAQSGKHFDPDVVDALLRVIEKAAKPQTRGEPQLQLI